MMKMKLLMTITSLSLLSFLGSQTVEATIASDISDNDAIKPGYYIIRNCALKDPNEVNKDHNLGLLSIANEKPLNSEKFHEAENSSSGHHVQVLTGERYLSLKDGYLPGGRKRNNILWEISYAEKEGTYLIKNLSLKREDEHNVGLLSYSSVRKSVSGHYVQVLTDSPTSAYQVMEGEKDKYLPGAGKRNNILWKINFSQNGKYTITNHALQGNNNLGNLSWAEEDSSRGRYSQLLADYDGSAYADQYERYFPNGRWEQHIQWELTRVEK